MFEELQHVPEAEGSVSEPPDLDLSFSDAISPSTGDVDAQPVPTPVVSTPLPPAPSPPAPMALDSKS